MCVEGQVTSGICHLLGSSLFDNVSSNFDFGGCLRAFMVSRRRSKPIPHPSVRMTPMPVESIDSASTMPSP